MLRDPEEEVAWKLLPVLEDSRVLRRVERCHTMAPDEVDCSLCEGLQQCRYVSGDGGTGVSNGIASAISPSSRTPRSNR